MLIGAEYRSLSAHFSIIATSTDEPEKLQDQAEKSGTKKEGIPCIPSLSLLPFFAET
jgi:hypothetical protein